MRRINSRVHHICCQKWASIW